MEENKKEGIIPAAEDNAPAATPETSETRPARFSEEDLAALADALAKRIAPAEEEPDPEQEAREAAEAARALKLKRRKRRRKNLVSFLVRTVLLALVVYVLFFHVIGVTTMPNGDMYPRIDAGDFIVFYRLDKEHSAQDIVVFEKDAAQIQEFVDRAEAGNLDEDEDVSDLTEATGEPGETPAEPALTPEPTAGPGPVSTPENTVVVPASTERVPQQLAGDTSFKAKVFRLIYDAQIKLGLRRKDGNQTYICRVVAKGGDTVEITEGGSLVVNGNTMIESNIFSETTEYVGFTEYPLTLAPDEYFVLADKRNGGADSRFFGPVKADEIKGVVITIARRNNL